MKINSNVAKINKSRAFVQHIGAIRIKLESFILYFKLAKFKTFFFKKLILTSIIFLESIGKTKNRKIVFPSLKTVFKLIDFLGKCKFLYTRIYSLV